MSEISGLSQAEESLLEKAHYQQWLDSRAAHIEQVTLAARTRLASLDTTHQARLALLEEQRDQASETRIRRMREAQIEAARRDYAQRASVLKIAPEQADILAEAVAFGILLVESKP